MTNTQGLSGQQAGKKIAGMMRNEAASQSRIVRAQVSNVDERITDGRIKCTIPALNQTVYVEAASTFDTLAVNDWVWIKKMDAGWRDMWILWQFDRTAAGSFVPTIRPDAIALDHLDADDGDPAPAWSCDAAGRLVPQAATCYLLMSGYAGALTLDADGDTAIDATVDDRIDFKMNATLRHSLGLTAAVFNENGDDMDTRIEASGQANAFFVQGSDGMIGIGTGTPTNQLHLSTSSHAVMKFQTTNAANIARFYYVLGDGTGADGRQWLMGVYGSDGNKYKITKADSAGSTWTDVFAITPGGLFGIGTASPASLMEWNMATENLEFVDAGSAAATEQDWITVEVGGVTGYIRVYAAK